MRVRGPSDPPASAVDGTPSESDSYPVWPVALTLLAMLPIALRRRFPLLVLLVTLPAGLAMAVLYPNLFQFAGALVAPYTVARYSLGMRQRLGVARSLLPS